MDPHSCDRTREQMWAWAWRTPGRAYRGAACARLRRHGAAARCVAGSAGGCSGGRGNGAVGASGLSGVSWAWCRWCMMEHRPLLRPPQGCPAEALMQMEQAGLTHQPLQKGSWSGSFEAQPSDFPGAPIFEGNPRAQRRCVEQQGWAACYRGRRGGRMGV
ncbi:hypothetical protein DUNSADRAFT_18032 [Dunaliella salina]|uniref:Encoded protein n=1 Tax=Dunaliella salina TaxID=3046 RepID=A0ABQ7G0R9_DUNSA|nr:hypothetical protein DUNSADRAFT_18032 [Dunaliella salina]|eukprot:KAF5828207.1 hypothetical protein DUNSADRAFT_18032 [Dunaliella salina]